MYRNGVIPCKKEQSDLSIEEAGRLTYSSAVSVEGKNKASKENAVDGAKGMRQLLLVEDTRFFSNLVKKNIEQSLNIEVICAERMDEAQAILESGEHDFFLALLDLNLPDANDGEVVDLALSHDIPSIVFSAEFSDDVRDTILQKGVIDYVLKENPASLDYLVSLVARIYANQQVKTMIVDDSGVARKTMATLMRRYQFEVFEAANGKQALETLAENPDIKLVITDYNMPDMDGSVLTREIRRKFKKERLAIIGISSSGSNALSARFIKSGANDFINKPFLQEEFFCRICQNIDIIDYIENLQQTANEDFLTGVHNRRFFYDAGKTLHAKANRDNQDATLALIDIDHFKAINDSHGHDTGDQILIQLARLLASRSRESDILARLGGEEFALLATGLAPLQTPAFFEEMRASIEAHDFKVKKNTYKITVSIGVETRSSKALTDMITAADNALYGAKNTGRNRVMFSDPRLQNNGH